MDDFDRVRMTVSAACCATAVSAYLLLKQSLSQQRRLPEEEVLPRGPFLRARGAEFNLEHISPQRCYQSFRLHRENIYRLASALHLPHRIETPAGDVAPPILGLCVLLWRLSFPRQLSDGHDLFDR
jgi:hypothetical protein